ncbi:MAG: YidC/Oxa1 family membrane protein insertase [Clostridiales bacterium]|nr:YidC/Oxa1 family membrane protein insertase [Clostridiales bacterium]
MGALWGSLVGFLQSIILTINSVVGNYGVSVILFTLLIRLVLLPMDLKSKASMKKMSALNPEIQKINEKYKNDPEKKNKKVMELYQKHQVSPFGGCLPMLLQMPLMFAMFAALRAISSDQLQGFYVNLINYSNTAIGPALNEFVDKVQNAAAIKQSMGDVFTSLFSNPNNEKLITQLTEVVGSGNMTTIIDGIKNISTPGALNFLKTSESSLRFLWIRNVWIADSPLRDIIGRTIPFMEGGIKGAWNGLFILSGLAGLTSFLQTKLTAPPGDNQQAKTMNMIMPLMSIWFTSMYTSAFSIYWVTSNIFQIVQQLIYNRLNPETKTVKEGAKQ